MEDVMENNLKVILCEDSKELSQSLQNFFE